MGRRPVPGQSQCASEIRSDAEVHSNRRLPRQLPVAGGGPSIVSAPPRPERPVVRRGEETQKRRQLPCRTRGLQRQGGRYSRLARELYRELREVQRASQSEIQGEIQGERSAAGRVKTHNICVHLYNSVAVQKKYIKETQ